MDTGISNGVSRYYHWHDTSRKDSKGYNGVYVIIDRKTGNEVILCDTWGQADDKVKEMNKKDKIERGIKIIDLLEIPYSYREGRRAVTEVAPITIHK